jgi:hypothetical protein
LIEASGEQGVKSWRNNDVVVCLAAHRKQLDYEQRIAVGGSGDPFALPIAKSRRDELVDLGVAQSFKLQSDRPPGSPIDQLRSTGAKKQDGSSGREQSDLLDQVEEGLLAPLNVVENNDERLRLRLLL